MPDIRLRMIDCDYHLERLGFCDSAPCVIRFEITEEERDWLMEQLMDMEGSAYTTDSPSETSPEYKRYKKYNWIWDLLFYADYVPDP